MVRSIGLGLVLVVGWIAACPAVAADDPLAEQARSALRRAVEYLTTEVSTEGGYLYNYSLDLKRRAGEEVASEQTVWIEPPGTPAVGEALLKAYQNTGDDYYLEQARRTARCLIRGQLHSGGWDNRIEFDPEVRKKYAYRVDGQPAPKARNSTTLDDNKTQSAIRFLMRLDRELKFQDSELHEAVVYALDKLVEAQFANGAWPQQFSGPPDPDAHAPRKASYPESWSRTFPAVKYTEHYTFNDNAMGDCIDVMLLASQIYNEPRYRQAAQRCGDFVLLAQMPQPQPAWAQQYDAQMHPAWARKFEPPSITGGESQSIVSILLKLYEATGDGRYLEPVPQALAYLKTCELANGQIPRFIELYTSRPLYFTKDYVLTYDDSDVPTHYGFKVSSKVDALQSLYDRAKGLSPDKIGRPLPEFRLPEMSSGLRNGAQRAIDQLDAQGRWVTEGSIVDPPGKEPVLSMRTYIQNINALADYLGAVRRGEK